MATLPTITPAQELESLDGVKLSLGRDVSPSIASRSLYKIGTRESFSVPVTPNAMAFHAGDGNVYYGNRSSSVYVLDPSTGSVSTLAASEAILSFASDGTHLWLATDTHIHKVDPSAITTYITSYPLGANYLWGMTYDGTHLWLEDAFAQTFERVDPATGSVVQTITHGQANGRDITYANDRIYFITDVTLTIWDPVSGTQDPEELTVDGEAISHDGVDFWTNGTGVIRRSFIGTDIPDDLQTIDTLDASATFNRSVAGDDEIILACRVMSGTTVMAAGDSGGTYVTLGTVPLDGSVTSVSGITFSYVNPTTDASLWENASVSVQQTINRNMGADGVNAEIDIVALDGTYTPANPNPDTPVITNPVDASTVGGTVSLEATVTDPEGEQVRAVWELWETGTPGAVLQSITISASYPGLTHDGTSLWGVVSATTDEVHKIDPADGTVLLSYALPLSISGPSGAAHDGTDLWIADNGSDQINRCNANDGTVLQTFAAPNTFPLDLAWDGTHLWCVSGGQFNTIDKIDPADGTVLASFASPINGAGLAHDGAWLWVSTSGISGTELETIYQIDPADGSVLQSFEAPTAHGGGLAYDGTDLWWADTPPVSEREPILYRLAAVAFLQNIPENTALVASGTTHTTSWDASAITDGNYALRAWAVDVVGGRSASYDQHTITISQGGGTSQAILPASESDTAITLTSVKAKVLAITVATETDLVLPLVATKTAPLAAAASTSTAPPLTSVKRRSAPIQSASDSSAATPFTATKSLGVQPIATSSLATPLTATKTASFLSATSTDAPLPLTATKTAAALTAAASSSLATPLTATKSLTLAPALTLSTAVPLSAIQTQRLAILPASDSSSASPLTATKARVLAAASTTASSTPLAATKTASIQSTTTSAASVPVVPAKTVPLTSPSTVAAATTLSASKTPAPLAPILTLNAATTLTSVRLTRLVPDSSLDIGNWTDQSGGTVDLHLTIDEFTANDADYIAETV